MATREENIARCREIRRQREDHKRWIREQNAFARSQRSPKQQLDRLDDLLGVGVGAIKERKRLRALIS